MYVSFFIKLYILFHVAFSQHITFHEKQAQNYNFFLICANPPFLFLSFSGSVLPIYFYRTGEERAFAGGGILKKSEIELNSSDFDMLELPKSKLQYKFALKLKIETAYNRFY